MRALGMHFTSVGSFLGGKRSCGLFGIVHACGNTPIAFRDRQIDLSFDCPDLLTAFFTIDSSGFSLEAYDDEDADGVGDGAGVLPPFAFTENDLFSPVTCMMNVF